MHLTTGWTTLSVAPTTTTRAFTARPAGTVPLPGIIVIQEIWGVDPHIQDLCARLATAGFAAIAPDLFGIGGIPEALTDARIEDAKRFLDTLPVPAWFDASLRVDALSKLPEPDRTWMTATLELILNRNRPFDLYTAAIVGARNWLAANSSTGRKIGATGFCMGGGLALRAASQLGTGISGVAPFYGAIGANELLPKVTCPVLGHFADQDPGVNASLPALKDGLGDKLTLHQYPGARHAFFNDTRSTFEVNSARLAWSRTLSFFAEHLA